jgi:hypothetical protein
MESESVEVMDLYLAAYYLVKGCTLEGVEPIRVGSSTSAYNIIVRGEVPVIVEVQRTFFASTAEVNLLAFRNAYNRVNNAIHHAKRARSSGESNQGGGL